MWGGYSHVAWGPHNRWMDKIVGIKMWFQKKKIVMLRNEFNVNVLTLTATSNYGLFSFRWTINFNSQESIRSGLLLPILSLSNRCCPIVRTLGLQFESALVNFTITFQNQTKQCGTNLVETYVLLKCIRCRVNLSTSTSFSIAGGLETFHSWNSKVTPKLRCFW